MQKPSMVKMDNRVFESATWASQLAIKGQEKSPLEKRCGFDSRGSEKPWDDIRIVIKLNRGRDGAVRSARINCGKSMLERAIQHLCIIEFSCNLATETEKDPASLNVKAREYIPEPTAVVAPKLQIREAAEYERKLPTV